MKTVFIILAFILCNNLVLPQENLFVKTDESIFTKRIKEKIERLKTRDALKQWKEVQIKPNTVNSKSFKGILNIFDKNIEFEITKDLGIDANGIQGYKAELKDGGYALFSIDKNDM